MFAGPKFRIFLWCVHDLLDGNMGRRFGAFSTFPRQWYHPCFPTFCCLLLARIAYQLGQCRHHFQTENNWIKCKAFNVQTICYTVLCSTSIHHLILRENIQNLRRILSEGIFRVSPGLSQAVPPGRAQGILGEHCKHSRNLWSMLASEVFEKDLDQPHSQDPRSTEDTCHVLVENI